MYKLRGAYAIVQINWKWTEQTETKTHNTPNRIDARTK